MKNFLKYFLSVHVLCLLMMTLVRVCLLYIDLPAGDWNWLYTLRALLIGVKFDNLIACYIASPVALIMPILALSTSHLSSHERIMLRAQRVATWWFAVLYAIVLFVSLANIRYYQFFDNHLNIQVTEWFRFAGTTAGMLFGDKGNYLYLLLGIVFIAVFEYLLWTISRRLTDYSCHSVSRKMNVSRLVGQILVSILLWGAVFCGIRGSFQRYPLHVSFAYFCDNAFYNKLGINPIFNIIKSMEYKEDELPAILRTVPQEDLFCPSAEVPSHEGLQGKNVVIILMESMAEQNLHRVSQLDGQPLTPYLSSLRDSALYFENFYSAGVHTNNGIAATLYGYAPNFAHTMMSVPSTLYTGLPVTLRAEGYRTHCFVTSNPQYDSMNSFLRDNGFERLHSIYDYPASEAVNNFGVPDAYLFRYGIEQLDVLAQDSAPFLATFVTVSNHSPFVVPEGFVQRGEDDDARMIAYADACVGDFMHQALQRDWARNTIFVLLGDHGTTCGANLFDMTLQYNKIPCFILGTDMENKHLTHPASQIDIFPTIMGVLGYAYTNNTLGIDLLRENRELVYFVNNDHLGCADEEYFYTYNLNTNLEFLYRFGSSANLKDEEPERLERMRNYAVRNMAINLNAISQGWTAPQK